MGLESGIIGEVLEEKEEGTIMEATLAYEIGDSGRRRFRVFFIIFSMLARTDGEEVEVSDDKLVSEVSLFGVSNEYSEVRVMLCSTLEVAIKVIVWKIETSLWTSAAI